MKSGIMVIVVVGDGHQLVKDMLLRCGWQLHVD